ncbi:MAG: von Willebrand factor type A domain-containing protein [Deltaproteobacteria bacterium]|nr:von Willebrand factor type A domain-containing protein [Deltaproteobacteria bacterium]
MAQGAAAGLAFDMAAPESVSRGPLRADVKAKKVASRGAEAFGRGGLGGKSDDGFYGGQDELRVGGQAFEVKEAVSAGINDLIDARDDALSTFAIDVDTGSWTLAKRFLQGGALPNPQAVRVEEWVNAFSYSYPAEGALHPFTIHLEGAPLAKQSMVLRVGIQGKEIEKREREPAHLTFLVDVSGSMRPSDRLPLAKQALELLVRELNGKDSVSIATYAGGSRLVLPMTRADGAGKGRILDAIASLQSGGGTAMGDGMVLAYQEATKALGQKGSSRVIVLSDGDANIGRTGHAEILKSIKGYVSEGVTMSTVGFGVGNYREHLMEQLADAGNGNYSYVGSLDDAKKIFVDKMTGTLQVIAKDTKIQVAMNPDVVQSYRLIGYENRDVADRDFRNDKVDAGEIGAGHTVTALYEVVLRDDEPKGDIATVRVRYKQPKGERATETEAAFTASALRHDVKELSADGRFAAGIGLVAEALRHSPHMDRLGLSVGDALRLMESGAAGPHAAERREAVRLIAPLVEGAPVAWR